ncbi:MAG TPA: hypothetical protein VIG76_07410 [Amnibacterium sp.]|uniref:hypothetical protein n=1 Tax=Amnibacterium sp. TaxID=1872496 RepID=UPI002F91FED0
MTVESGAHLLASGLIVGATLILTGEAQGRVHVADGGRAGIVGRVEGAVEATAAADVRVAGEVDGPCER